MKKICFAFFVLVLSLSFFIPQRIQAITLEDCEKKIGQKELSLDEAKECQQIFADLSQKATAEKKSLQSEIGRFDKLINLTTAQIYVTAKEIKLLEEEISVLVEKIGHLDISLDQLSQLLIKRIAETYKKGKIDPLALFFSSQDFSEFISRYKYLKVIQLHDRSLMVQMETVRTNYDDQKTLKEEKQVQLEAAKKKLESQKVLLAQQKEAKNVLLVETKGKETEYQRILASLREEKARLAGAGLFGKPAEFKIWTEANNYFNQTDKRWAMDLIGGGTFYDVNDPSYMWKYGCAVTSMAMVLKKSGVDVDPQRLAAQPIYRTDLIAWQHVPDVYGGRITIEGHGYGGYPDWGTIDNQLSAGRWVIVYISNQGHYVVLLNKEGEDYKMHDPYFGNELSFNSKYSKSAVDEMVIYER